MVAGSCRRGGNSSRCGFEVSYARPWGLSQSRTSEKATLSLAFRISAPKVPLKDNYGRPAVYQVNE